MDGSSLPGPRRRPADGGYARGAETRDRIIEAAFVVFAEEGYVRASTRRIAAEAGVNPPALQYYFDSKEGLHRACGQAIVDGVLSSLAESVARAREALAAEGPEPAVEALCELAAKISELAMEDRGTEAWSRFMNRCETDDAGPAFGLIQSQISTPMKATFIELVAKTRGEPSDKPEVRLHALLIMSQISAFHTHRDRTLEIVGWKDFDGPRAGIAKAILCDHVRKLVTA